MADSSESSKSAPRYAAALRLHALPRVISYSLATVMLVLQGRVMSEATAQYVLAAYAMFYPWLVHAWAAQRADDRRTIPRLFVMDGINAGVGVAVFGFSPAASLYLVGVTLGNTIAYGGLRSFVREMLWIAAAAATTRLVLGPVDAVAPRAVELIALCGFVAYTLLLGFNSHVVAERLRRASRSVREQAQALERASRTDPLTGAANRRHLYERLRSVSNLPWALVLIDLDHFKRINDEYGHDAGDRVLCETVNRLARVFPPPDHVVRWGGEEFLVVIEHERPDLGRVLTDLLTCLRTEPMILADGTSLTVTCSCGAVLLAPFADWSDALALADHALYQAKASGRDRACFPTAPSIEPSTGRAPDARAETPELVTIHGNPRTRTASMG